MDIRVGISVIFAVVTTAVVAQNDPIGTVCAPTQYKEVCKQSLSEVAPKGTTDPKELLKASVQAIINEVQAASNFSASLVPNATDPMLKKSLENCNRLYQSAIGDLQSALSFLGTNELQNLNNKVIELQNWLSASLSFQTTCLDGVDDPKFKDMLAGKASKARELNSNALAIIASLPQVLNSVNKA